jgi:hypothetical protein
MIDFGLFAAGFASWAISTLSAGGGSVLILAAMAVLLRGHAIAPVVTLASAIASPIRIILFWRDIEWAVVRWYVPGATAGAMFGSWAFTHISGHLLQVAVGAFLLSTSWQYRLGDKTASFPVRLPWFVPVSFVSGVTSAIVGASGLLANPFYLNYGLTKERMLATRAVNSLVDLVRHGVTVGAGAGLAIWVTRPWLHRLNPCSFRKFAVLVMVLAGLLILWQQRVWLHGLVSLS